ncbi:modulator of drug activity B [Escherichia coli]|nr:modulator of drug activity B [Escherichia coli]
MSNILIINGAKKFAHSNGQLNDTLTGSRGWHTARPWA